MAASVLVLQSTGVTPIVLPHRGTE